MNRTTRSSPRQPRGSIHSPTYLYFCSLFLFQICLNYFSATKIHHIAQHRFPSVGPMLHRFHYIDLVTQKSPHCYDTKQSQIESGMVSYAVGHAQSGELISKWGTWVTDTKWFFWAFPFTHQCPPQWCGACEKGRIVAHAVRRDKPGW